MTYIQQKLIDLGQNQFTSDDYYTPAWIFNTLALRFDLDVCAPSGGVPWIPAERYYTLKDDGLTMPWFGRVWMNPPFSNATPWVHRFIAHANGVALVPHSKSVWHRELWEAADACTETERFDFVGGSIFMPVWFAAFGNECVEALNWLGVVRVRV